MAAPLMDPRPPGQPFSTPPHPHGPKRLRGKPACDQCRKKKTRCDGERPTCEFCSRLGQACTYDTSLDYATPPRKTTSSPLPLQDHPDVQRLVLDVQRLVAESQKWATKFQSHERRIQHGEERMQLTESRLNEVMTIVLDRDRDAPPVNFIQRVNADGSNAGSGGGDGAGDRPAPHKIKQVPLPASDQLPSWEIIANAVEIYALNCDCQPLALFQRDHLMKTYGEREVELVCALLAWTLRFAEETDPLYAYIESATIYVDMARAGAMYKITQGQVELSTLQTLCIIGLLDFTDGNPHRARLHWGMAETLAVSSGLHQEPGSNFPEPVTEERRRCFWSILQLQNLHGLDAANLDLRHIGINIVKFPRIAGDFYEQQIDWSYPPSTTMRDPWKRAGDQPSLAGCALHLTEVWKKIRHYTKLGCGYQFPNNSKIPPWDMQSDYHFLLREVSGVEMEIPRKHRYKASGFEEIYAAEMNMNRSFWGAFLFAHFMYHTSHCVIAHPLFLSLRMGKKHKQSLPQVFREQNTDLLTTQSQWVLRLITSLKDKGFRPTDPVLAQCAAIVATVFLQQSFVADLSLRERRQAEFAKCLDFMADFRGPWPHVARLHAKLERLNESVVSAYEYVSRPAHVPHRVLVKLALFWDVLECTFAGEAVQGNTPLFGESLAPVAPVASSASSTSRKRKADDMAADGPGPAPYDHGHPHPQTREGSASLLPPPRIDGHGFSAVNAQPPPRRDAIGSSFEDSSSVPRGAGHVNGSASATGTFDGEQQYSDEELVILADALFGSGAETARERGYSERYTPAGRGFD